MTETAEYISVCSFKLKFNPEDISGVHLCCGGERETEIDFKILQTNATAEITCKFCGYKAGFVYYPGIDPARVIQSMKRILLKEAKRIERNRAERNEWGAWSVGEDYWD